MATAENNQTKSAQQLKSDIDTLRKDMSTATDDLKQISAERARDSVNRINNRTRRVALGLEGEIRARPLASVCAALGAGLVLGKLLPR